MGDTGHHDMDHLINYTATIPIVVIKNIIDYEFQNWNVINYYTETIVILVNDENNYNWHF